MFCYYNPIKFENSQTACIPRALSLIFNINTIDETDDIKQTWRKILLDNGFEYINIPAIPFKKRMTVKELAGINDANDIIVCSCGDHVVYIHDHKYFDICDTGDRCVFYYFKKKGEVNNG